MALAGKQALINGSSLGIGRGVTLKLAEMDAKVAIHYYHNEAAANDTLAMVERMVPTASSSRPMSRSPVTFATCSKLFRLNLERWTSL